MNNNEYFRDVARTSSQKNMDESPVLGDNKNNWHVWQDVHSCVPYAVRWVGSIDKESHSVTKPSSVFPKPVWNEELVPMGTCTTYRGGPESNASSHSKVQENVKSWEHYCSTTNQFQHESNDQCTSLHKDPLRANVLEANIHKVHMYNP